MEITIGLISKIVGALMWFAFGGFFFWGGLPHKMKKVKNYSQYPRAMGKYVYEYRTYSKTREAVIRFVDAEGVERLGFHDWGEKLPREHPTGEVYYWKRTDGSQYSLNFQPIDYMVHYCDSHIYDGYLESMKRPKPFFLVTGSILIAVGVFLLLFGNR